MNYLDDFTISKRTELMLYRIVQELINNIMKHAQATEATILLKYTNQQLQIEITDNGIGISQNQEIKDCKA
ncbi:MAG: ATP-binding protein [Chitinophagales bacterium]